MILQGSSKKLWGLAMFFQKLLSGSPYKEPQSPTKVFQGCYIKVISTA